MVAEQNRFNHQTEIKWLQKWCYRRYRYTKKNEANISSFCEIKYVHCFEVTLIMTEKSLFSEMVLCGQNDTFLTISPSNLHCLKRTIFPKNNNTEAYYDLFPWFFATLVLLLLMREWEQFYHLDFHYRKNIF